MTQEYWSQLSGLLTGALDYLHNSVNWGLGVVTGIIAIVLIRTGFPDLISWFILWFSLILTMHFATRTAKGYLNVIRWSTIQRHIIDHNTGRSPDRPTLASVLEHITKYHREWQSPLTRGDVVVKVVRELGYGYFLLLPLGLIAYVGAKQELHLIAALAPAVAVPFSIWEVLWLLFKSPYMKNVCPDSTARQLK